MRTTCVIDFPLFIGPAICLYICIRFHGNQTYYITMIALNTLPPPGTIMQCNALKRKCLHLDEIFITGCIGSCQDDNFQCIPGWKLRQNEISISEIFITGCTGSCYVDNDLCRPWWKFRQNNDIFISVKCGAKLWQWSSSALVNPFRHGGVSKTLTSS